MRKISYEQEADSTSCVLQMDFSENFSTDEIQNNNTE